MKGIVFADRSTRATFADIFEGSAIEVTWVEAPNTATTEAPAAAADFALDLNFDASRIPALTALPVALILVGAVASPLPTTDTRFARINAWNTFLQRPLVELVAGPEAKAKATAFCKAWGKTPEFVPDLPGMPSARVVSMIVNEAYLALGEDVSTKEAIDIAMRLGTNYPFGPFEWSRKIGLEPIVELLEILARENPLYAVAPRLKQEHGLIA